MTKQDCGEFRLPDLEDLEGRDPHRKCMSYAIDALAEGQDPFHCECITPEALREAFWEAITEERFD